VIGDGAGVWDHVHVEDLAYLYEIAVLDALESGGKAFPTGKKGIIFSANGRHSWKEVAQAVADACCAEGKITDNRVESVGLTEGTKILSSALPQADEGTVELSLTNNSQTVSTVARQLGWNPTRGEEPWKTGFRDDVKAVLKKRETS
jgi:nucleoside-diphosphate-sugar epimerase